MIDERKFKAPGAPPEIAQKWRWRAWLNNSVDANKFFEVSFVCSRKHQLSRKAKLAKIKQLGFSGKIRRSVRLCHSFVAGNFIPTTIAVINFNTYQVRHQWTFSLLYDLVRLCTENVRQIFHSTRAPCSRFLCSWDRANTRIIPEVDGWLRDFTYLWEGNRYTTE